MQAVKIILVLVIAAGVAFALVRLGAGSSSDEALINQALDDSVKAGEEGRPGGVLEHLSKGLVFNDESVGFSRKSIADFIRDQKPKVTIGTRAIEIAADGKTAQLRAPVTLTLKVLTFEKPVTLNNVVMEFAKEDARDYLVFPTRKWRITKVTAPEFDPSQWAAGAMGF